MKILSGKMIAALCGCVLFVSITRAAHAEPTQEEVFQSINDNVRSTQDFSKAVPYMVLAAAVIILSIGINYHLKHRNIPRKSYSPAKLSRELARRINLRSIELKQLKILAEEMEVEFPLTLILCPSLLGKAIRSQTVLVDRAVVQQMVGKLRAGLEG